MRLNGKKLAGVVLGVFVCLGVSSGTAVGAESDTFKGAVWPLMEKYCAGCHGPKKDKGDVRVDTLDRDFLGGADVETWHDLLDSLNRGEMPPEDEDLQPSVAERAVMVDWITEQMLHAAQVKRSTGGQGVIRRLTRYEYNHTMADLLGVKLDYAANLPPETNSADGFKNNGSLMGMSGMQLEYYLRAAQLGLSKALVEGKAPKRFRHVGTENVTRRTGKEPKEPHTRKIQPGNSFWMRMLDYPTEGPVRVKVRAYGVVPEGKGPPRMRVKIGVRADTYVPGGQVGEDVDVLAVEGSPGSEGEYEFVGRLEDYPMLGSATNFPGLVVTVHNVYDDGSDAIELLDAKIGEQEKKLNAPAADQPWLVVERVEFVAPDYEVWPPEYHRGILFKGAETPEDEAGYARQVVERFMTRAYRRPVSAGEVEGIMGFYAKVRPLYPTFVQTMRQTLSMVLVSPSFLYLVEPAKVGDGAKGRVRELSGYEVASRLSYFLWSTMPDEELFELAESGALLEGDVLNEQVERMLVDAKSDRFVKQFTDQWLDLGALDRVAVNPQFYPDFKDRVKGAMRGESESFFREILREDLSAMHFIDSDFAMLNERLAKHYGIEGVAGNAFRRVGLTVADRRGGLLTQGSMLVGNSTGEDSHVINRAVWILKRMLDDPPAPPPANVPALDSETPGFDKLSLKDQLKAHREDEACVSCHLKIDPWGIPLEHYDAAGLYREEALRLTASQRGRARTRPSKAPVDAVDVMPDGQKVEGVEGLKGYLLSERKDDVSRAIVVKLLAYSLGRSLEFTDEDVVGELAGGFKEGGYRLDRLIESIVGSRLFLTR